jgi:hypothetical protein
MNIKLLAVVAGLVLLLLVSLVLIQSMPSTPVNGTSPGVYVGIDAAYDNETITALIDEVSSYTNLFIVGCTAITENESMLNSICQYLYDKGMSFIIYQDVPVGYYQNSRLPINQTLPLNATNSPYPPSTNLTRPEQGQPYNFTRPIMTNTVSNWTATAKDQWGTHFLGIYYIDELAGRQLDLDRGWVEVRNATDCTDAANQFNRAVSSSIDWIRSGYSDGTDVSLFSSDYALYQFDYAAGYDVILAQLGWNYSRQLNIALCRGAATVADKDWGVIVTWEYTEPPYLESGSKLYDDMVLAYNNGAKYIVVFDSNEAYTQSILTQDHLNALKQFWQYVEENPRSSSSASGRVGFVLPADYAYGFRGPNDSIWGLWSADSFSMNLSISVGNNLSEYEEKLDIVYNQTRLEACGYGQLIYWNT